MEPIIRVSHFSKSYGDFKAVDDISFCVEEGEIFAFLGPNGAGKSTTINTLCTILDKTAGDMRIGGHDVSAEQSAVRKDIGIVFQESTLDAKLTVEENLRFHCRFYQVPKQEVAERVDFVLDLVDLQEWRKTPVGGLSGGMKRRVEIARALIHYPKVLFLDEPTAGLDPQTRANVWEYIQKLQKQKNITIFLTTHYMDEAEICAHVAIMDHGKIIAFDTPENLKKQYTHSMLIVYGTRLAALETECKAKGFPCEPAKGKWTVTVPDSCAALELLEHNREQVTDSEMTKGTLNDVFLKVTGKEIRV